MNSFGPKHPYYYLLTGLSMPSFQKCKSSVRHQGHQKCLKCKIAYRIGQEKSWVDCLFFQTNDTHSHVDMRILVVGLPTKLIRKRFHLGSNKLLSQNKKRYLLYNISYKEMNALAPWNTQGCVSRPNSKSGFLIRKQIFRFFAKIQKRIIDPNDAQWRWILWIILIWIYYPKRFLYYGSEKSKYCQR